MFLKRTNLSHNSEDFGSVSSYYLKISYYCGFLNMNRHLISFILIRTYGTKKIDNCTV